MARILCVDNYDSFVFTIVGYLRHLGAVVDVVRNDVVDPAWFEAGYDGVLISPGPGDPKSAGASLQTIADCAEREIPMLGVCLGHQALGERFGATAGRAPACMGLLCAGCVVCAIVVWCPPRFGERPRA